MLASDVDVEEGVLECLDWVPSCSCTKHVDVVPPAEWVRVLDCGCVSLQCGECKEYDLGVVVRFGMGRCTRCDLVVGILRVERL